MDTDTQAEGAGISTMVKEHYDRSTGDRACTTQTVPNK